jgi:type IV pilus assembly protein PilE
MSVAKCCKPTLSLRGMSGVTLMELLVTVTIVGILGAIAYPSYTQYITRTKRAVGKSMLLQVADRQEQFFADNKRYATNLTQIGYAANGFMIDDQGAYVVDGDANRLYQVSLTNATVTTFTANAAPQLRQATQDTDCQTLTLTHRGLKGQTGPSTNCW